MNMWTAIVLIVMAAMASEAWRHHVKARGAAPRQEELDDLKRKIDGSYGTRVAIGLRGGSHHLAPIFKLWEIETSAL